MVKERENDSSPLIICITVKKLTEEEINKELEPRGFTLVSRWVNIRTSAQFRCKYGHEWTGFLNNIRRGIGCPYCSGKAKLSVKEINALLANRGIKLVGTYKCSKSLATFECEYGHVWESCVDKVKNAGRGCPICAKPRYIYIFKDNTYGIKLGVSNNPNRRLQEIRKSANLYNLDIYAVYTFSKSAFNLESLAHNHFKNRQVLTGTVFDGYTEFFNVTPEEADKYLLDNGAVRC